MCVSVANNTAMPSSAPVVKALLFSGFPPRFTQSSIIDRLAKHGVRVTEVGDPKNIKARGFDTADVVLVMYEMLGHAEDTKIKLLADQHRKRVIYLSRKAAMWPQKLAPVVAHQAPPPASQPAPAPPKQPPKEIAPMPAALQIVPALAPSNLPSSPYERIKATGQVEAFLRCVQQLAEQGLSYRRMLEDPSRFAAWLGDLPMDPQKLANAIQMIVSAGLAPEDFVEWRKKRDTKSGHTGAPVSAELAEMESLANEYAKENAQLKGEIERLTGECTELSEALSKSAASMVKVIEENDQLRLQIRQQQQTNQPASKFDPQSILEAFTSLDTLAGLGLIDAKQALAALRKVMVQS